MLLSRVFPELWKFGSLERATRGAPIVLVADVVNGAAESRYSALREPGGAAGYQVTAGKTLWLTRVVMSADVANTEWLLGSGTADAGSSQVAAPAGMASESSRADGVANVRRVPAAYTPVEYDILFDVVAGRYPCVRGLSQNTTLQIEYRGIEV
jgi:hypothetical protein